jgi:hypothetical protein
MEKGRTLVKRASVLLRNEIAIGCLTFKNEINYKSDDIKNVSSLKLEIAPDAVLM